MKSKWLFALFLLSLAGLAHAEGGCPSGMIPYRGMDLSSCGPVPEGYYGNNSNNSPQSVTPPARWADRWGAIAFSDINNSVGVSVDMESERAAKKAAIADCISVGGEKCSTQNSYHNQCGVIAWGDRYGNTARARTVEEASDIAMKTCDKNTENCKIVYSNCTRARRIQ